ncbi:hypothetical protein FQZ97_1143180 [compost metagenome]
MVQTRQGFGHGHHLRPPGLLDQLVLAQELAALAPSGHAEQRAPAVAQRWRGQPGGAGLFHLRRCQAQGVGNKGRVAQRLQIEHA